MENKDNYSENELHSALKIYREYLSTWDIYNFHKDDEQIKDILNENVEECEKVIPKSLIDKLGIKKIE